MSPTIENSYYGSNMYPVARKKINPENTSFSVSVDLAGLARNGNIWWLSEYNFDETSMEKMVGCHVFMSDGYSYEWGNVDFGSGNNFYFENNRPSGAGYSNLREFPDTDLGESWTTFTLLGEGLYRNQDTALGGEPILITLQLSYDDIGGNYVEMNVPGHGSSILLYSADADVALSDPANKKYVWKVNVCNTADADPLTIDADGAFSNSWISVQYLWMYTDFYYLGEPVAYAFKTDFDSNHESVPYPTFDPVTDLTKDPAIDNNWHIGQLDAADQPNGASATNWVLGLGSPGLNDDYIGYRDDSIIFPEVDYSALTSGGEELKISFNIRKDLDFQWWDSVSIEIERNNGTYWDQIDSFWGPLEQWSIGQNNGWTNYETTIWSYLIESGTNQRIRLRFNSNDWGEASGVFIDDLKIFTIN
jgi:hypothetical protein